MVYVHGVGSEVHDEHNTQGHAHRYLNTFGEEHYMRPPKIPLDAETMCHCLKRTLHPGPKACHYARSLT